VAHRQARARTIAQRGELILETDPTRPSGRLLRQAEMDASYIDLADLTHLEFDYMRWLRILLRVAGARRVLHIGGGACALARALAVEDPGGRQEVCEIDGDVLALAREHLGLRGMPGLRVRHTDGRSHLAAQPDASWDAVVIDAFVGAQVPPRLISVEALREAARVAPLTLVNVVDNRSAREVGRVAAAMALAYPTVWALGQQIGNTIVSGCAAGHQPDLGLVAARAAADPSPARIITPAQLAGSARAIPPIRDSASARGFA
jgi:protein-L-isoaspartate O-methyltransferase